jgi:UDP-N-acetylglucosamine acyltransferase
MAYTHVAHDCDIGNHIIFANNASLSGHVTVGDYANLSGMTGVHQFCSIGMHSFLAGGATVFKDVPHFMTVFGYPAQAHGLNSVGLERRGYAAETISILRSAYKIIYRQGNTVSDAIAQLEALGNNVPEVKLLIDFLLGSKRGIVR